ncbi:zinc-ribbon domain-containing protein [Aquimarina sp. AU474]|uniref:zinc-ribbon domain-containing protein n=1 Tax=Aquimarina sp. AU474 TaxID=2108529 RepID=UPI000D6873BB|nr:zinc-ribbon domain-containing protein [Aquimarina sp. AU474]
MIIFGTGSSTIQPQKLNTGDCPYCKTENSMWVQGYKKYVHIFWIPFFPIGKKVYTVCEHCKGVFEKKEIQNQKLLQSFEDFKINNVKTPWHHFIGLIILTLLIVFIIIVPIIK